MIHGGTLKSKTLIPMLLLLVFLPGLTSCRSRADRPYQPKINPEFLESTKEELFAKGEDFFEREKWSKAREYYTYVYENFPNDPLSSRSLLRIADTYFNQGGDVNLVEAQYKYRDYINRYPTSELAEYAMLQIANVAYEQMEKPDRDQSKTREAIQKYREMLQLYPSSQYRGEAEQRLQEALDSLAEHERLIAAFYLKRGDYKAALPRLEGLLEDFPEFAKKDEVFYHMGQALAGLGREGEARLYFDRVLVEFPESKVADDARKELAKLEG
jgi:outer membrane protein assembly factor BamD